VDGIDVADLGGGDDAVDLEIALRARARSDTDGFVGGLNVEGVVIGLGIDGEGADPEVLAGADHPESDFAAISNEDFVKHGGGDREGIPPESLRWA
jgi:hypothetical protein